MSSVGIRELKQNASAVVARAKAGEIVTITERGKPVARLTPIGDTRLQELIDAGLASTPTADYRDVKEPTQGSTRDGRTLTEILMEMRDAERY
jgi:prevent-host-death family protein